MFELNHDNLVYFVTTNSEIAAEKKSVNVDCDILIVKNLKYQGDQWFLSLPAHYLDVVQIKHYGDTQGIVHVVGIFSFDDFQLDFSSLGYFKSKFSYDDNSSIMVFRKNYLYSNGRREWCHDKPNFLRLYNSAEKTKMLIVGFDTELQFFDIEYLGNRFDGFMENLEFKKVFCWKYNLIEFIGQESANNIIDYDFHRFNDVYVLNESFMFLDVYYSIDISMPVAKYNSVRYLVVLECNFLDTKVLLDSIDKTQTKEIEGITLNCNLWGYSKIERRASQIFLDSKSLRALVYTPSLKRKKFGSTQVPGHAAIYNLSHITKN